MANGNSPALTYLRIGAYAIGLCFVLGAFFYGWSYYTLPLADRPQSSLHTILKPGGVWGHGLGVIGSAMILLLFLYSARKRKLFGLRWGAPRRWLSVHIFFGVMGPLLVTLHTAFKFNGIVSIGYYAMAAVALSGIFGRYIYIQIPRSATGTELELQDVEKQAQELERRLVTEYNIGADTLRALDHTLVGSLRPGSSGLRATLKSDIARLFTGGRALRKARALLGNVSSVAANEILELAQRRALLTRRTAYLGTFKRLFHNWHVFHKPFAYVMIIVVLIHVTITVLFGYRWIF